MMNKKIVTILVFLLSYLSSNASHEKGSSRVYFSSTMATNLSLSDNKIVAVNALVNNGTPTGFFDYQYHNKLMLGIDRNITSLGNIASLLPQQIFTAVVHVNLNYSQLNQSGSNFVYNQQNTSITLTVSFSGNNSHLLTAPSNEIDIDSYNYERGYISNVTITKIDIFDNNNNQVAYGVDLPENIYLELTSDAERYYDLNTSSTYPFNNNSDVKINYYKGTDSGNEIEVSWIKVNGAEAYELEWIWLDEYAYSIAGNLPANPFWMASQKLDFRNNSTKIRTDESFYRITNVYESGHLFFRIRAVGICKTPITLTSLGHEPLMECYTNWTAADDVILPSSPAAFSANSINSLGNGSTISLNVGGGMITSNGVPFFIDLRSVSHESKKNWVYTASYAEEGKKNEVLNYYDGSQHSRQTVTKNNSDNIAVVGETYYDFIGRPAIQAMPTPVNDASIKFYQQTINGVTAFNFDDVSGNAFTKNIFAIATSPGQCESDVNGMKINAGTSEYYSQNNAFLSLNYNNGYTPKANKFPFTQTEYTPDKTGRVSRKSGVGSDFKIEHGTSVEKHDTRYLYGSVTQEELDRLFGSEVGHSKHYSKSVVIDANGQASITYLDQKGRTIATALGGSNPTNLSALKSSSGFNLSTTSTVLALDMLNKDSIIDPNSDTDNNILIGDQLEFHHNLVVTNQQNYEFDYRLLGAMFNSCTGSTTFPNLCYDCMYDLEFDIQDKCGNRPIGFNKLVYSLGKITIGSGSNIGDKATTMNLDGTGQNDQVNFTFSQLYPSSSNTNSLTVNLMPGEYSITKKLKVNELALQKYLEDYLSKCPYDINYFEQNEAGIIDTTDSEVDCDECVANLGTQSAFVATYLSNNSGSTTQDAINEYKTLIKECLEPCSYDSYCDMALNMMLSDFSPNGQYAEYNLNGTQVDASGFPLSIFNTQNSLPRSQNSNPPDWHQPLYYKGNLSDYFDKYGSPDYITVTGLGNNTYNPPLVANAPVTALNNPANEYLVSPKYLLNVEDFINNWKPSWAQSLITYHPEYCYLKSCLKNSMQQLALPVKVGIKSYFGNGPTYTPILGNVDIYTSDQYDSLLVNTDDLDDDLTTAGQIKVLQPLTYDPYFNDASNLNNTLGRYYKAPVGTTPNPNIYSNPATQIDFNGTFQTTEATNRFYNYKNSGLSLYQYAAIMATPLGNSAGISIQSKLASLLNLSSGYYSAATLPSNASDMNYILALLKPGTSSKEYRDLAFEKFKNSYLEMKSTLQQESDESYVMNGDCRGCNNCIGKTNFDYQSVNFTPYSNVVNTQYLGTWNNGIPSQQSIANSIIAFAQDWYRIYDPQLSPYNKDQFCGMATSALYASKTKRFFSSNDASELLSDNGNNTQAMAFAQTGLCPNAIDMQTFLNALVVSSAGSSIIFTTSPYNLSTNLPAFSQGLYNAIAPQNPVPFAGATYSFQSLSNAGLTYSSVIAIGANNTCTLELNLPSSLSSGLPAGINDWNNYNATSPGFVLTSIANITPVNGSGNPFTVVAYVNEIIGTTINSHTILLNGKINCIPLVGCSFPTPCVPNDYAKLIQKQFNLMAAHGTFTSSSQVNLTNSPYNTDFVNGLKPYLEDVGPSNNWTWQMVGSNITIQDNSGPNNNLLNILITNVSPNVNLSCIQTFQNITPDPANPSNFIIDGVINVPPSSQNPNNCANATVKIYGQVSFGPASAQTILSMGDCSFNLSYCNTKEHKVKRELEKLITSSAGNFNNIITSNSANLSSNIALTALLRSYINSTVSLSANNTNPPPVLNTQQNFYYWVQNSNSTSNLINGWLTVGTSQTPPSVSNIPNGSCNLQIQFKTAGNAFSNITSYDTNILPYGVVNNGNYYTCKVKVNLTGGGSDTLLISTCWPMKACEGCNGGGSANPPSNNNNVTVIIEDFSNPTDTSNIILYYDNPSSRYAYRTNNYHQSITNPIHFKRYTMCHKSGVLAPNTVGFSDEWSSGNKNFPSTGCYYYTTFPNFAGLINTAGALDNFHLIFDCDVKCQGKSIYERPFNLPISGVYQMNYPELLALHIPPVTNNTPQDQEYVEFYIDNVMYYSDKIANLLGSPPIQNINLNAGYHNFKIVFNHAINSWPNNMVQYQGLRGIGKSSLTLISAAAYAVPCQLPKLELDTMPSAVYEEPGKPYLKDLVLNTASEKYNAYIDSLKDQFIVDYKNHCIGKAVENLFMKYTNNEYHFTLYYYDQAGNLTRTVPPEGVKVVDLNAFYSGNQGIKNGKKIRYDRKNKTTNFSTNHRFLTTYHYNSLNQLVLQRTPDGGVSRFYYDNLGRLVASQNAEQHKRMLANSNIGPYSFTKYDALGRIIAIGEMQVPNIENTSNLPSGASSLREALSDPIYPNNFSIVSGSLKDQVLTYYGDDPSYTPIINPTTFNSGNQENTRSRIASVAYFDGNSTAYTHASHYSYDIHGNVKELIQDNPELGRFSNQQYKHIEYKYDLISGKVNSVVYQNQQPDMLAHKYEYDAGNRITNVFTSRDGLLWDQDAKYYYYLHGPLARVETGEHKVAGNDYAYTLQGWLKGVNSEALKPDNDMGKDGFDNFNNGSGNYDLNRYHARDAFGFALNYFTDPSTQKNDYVPINNFNNSSPGDYFLANLGSSTSITKLYNGNISGMSACYLSPDPSTIPINGLAGGGFSVNKYEPYTFMKWYEYDQLNRLKSATANAKAIDLYNNWMYTNTSNLNDEYNEEFVYDQNGNILNVLRNMAGSSYDNLTYHYYDETGGSFNPATSSPANATNRLAYVADANSGVTYNDIDNQSTGNYDYDANGNLILDQAEAIANIDWNTFGKIKRITRATVNLGRPDMEFNYDAMGNRVSKKVIDVSGDYNITYYVRDAQGNVMATYGQQVTGIGSSTIDEQLKLKELNLFGSSRLGLSNCNDILGIIQNNTNLSSSLIKTTTENKRVLGYKNYELNNHLGNVLSVISDRKLAADQNYDNLTDFFVPDILSATDYYAFGSPMPNRQFNNGMYRYGFNGQEKDNEVAGTGNINTAMFWEYDTRLGRRWNIDPLVKNWESSYSCFGSNPIWFNDVKGDDFDVANNKKSKDDIRSMVKKDNETYLNFSENGKVSLNFGKLDNEEISKILANDEGLNLVNDLYKSNKKFYYSNAEVEKFGGSFGDQLFFLARDGNGIVNASDNGKDSKNGYSNLPKAGYNGQVVISGQGNFVEGDKSKEGGQTTAKTRSSLVFHELAENYERTHNGVDYNGNKSNGGFGAHFRANRRELNWWGKSNFPGEATYENNPDLGKPNKELFQKYQVEISELNR